jgi:hypothetical protein
MIINNEHDYYNAADLIIRIRESDLDDDHKIELCLVVLKAMEYYLEIGGTI